MEGEKAIAEDKATISLGRHVYGLGAIALRLLGLAWGDFLPGQPVPDSFPCRAALAYAAGALMLLTGAAIQWPKTAAWGAAARPQVATALAGLLGICDRSLLPCRWPCVPDRRTKAWLAAILPTAMIVTFAIPIHEPMLAGVAQAPDLMSVPSIFCGVSYSLA